MKSPKKPLVRKIKVRLIYDDEHYEDVLQTLEALAFRCQKNGLEAEVSACVTLIVTLQKDYFGPAYLSSERRRINIEREFA